MTRQSSSLHPKMMKYFLLCTLVQFANVTCSSQAKQYIYYFDKDLNITDSSQSLFNGLGTNDDSLFKLVLFSSVSKRLILMKHFTDSTLQVGEGPFQSYYGNNQVELEGNNLNGKEDGWWEKWDSSGHILDSTNYQKGVVRKQISYEYFPDKTVQTILFDDLANAKTFRKTFNEDHSRVTIDTIREDSDKVFTKVEISASFPGGPAAWQRFISRVISRNIDDFGHGDYGTCILKFIVNTSGKVSNVTAQTMAGTHLAEILIKAIASGPNWQPAQQNGRFVNSYKLQPVTLSGTQ